MELKGFVNKYHLEDPSIKIVERKVKGSARKTYYDCVIKVSILDKHTIIYYMNMYKCINVLFQYHNVSTIFVVVIFTINEMFYIF